MVNSTSPIYTFFDLPFYFNERNFSYISITNQHICFCIFASAYLLSFVPKCQFSVFLVIHMLVNSLPQLKCSVLLKVNRQNFLVFHHGLPLKIIFRTNFPIKIVFPMHHPMKISNFDFNARLCTYHFSDLPRIALLTCTSS